MNTTITRWRNYVDTSAMPLSTSWAEWFSTFIAAPSFAGDKLHPGWSPAIFDPPKRAKQNVRGVTALVLDYDGKGTTIDQARELWAAWFGLLHTSKSHRVDVHCFRVIVPLSRVATVDEHAKLWRWAHARASAAAHEIDQAPKDAARFWYLPGIVDGGSYEVHPLGGDKLLDVDATIAEVDASRLSAYAQTAVERASAAVRNARETERNTTLNREAYSLAGLAEIDDTTIRQALHAAARDVGLLESEIRDTLSSAIAAGRAAPRAARSERANGSSRPRIRIDVDLDRVVDDAVRALTRDDRVYARGGQLVQVIRDASPTDGAGALIVRRVAAATLRERLCAVADWSKYDGRRKGDAPCVPPDDVVHALAARGEWSGLRPLVGVLEAPAMRPDGTIIQRPGYDAATGYLFVPSTTYPAIADVPSRADALRALDELDEVFCDFPFAKPAHHSAALAMLLSLVARPAIDGAVPMGAVDATTRGSGKGRLVDAIANVATGRDAAKTPLPEKDDEMGKLVSSLVAEGAILACLDNIARAIDLPSLDNALTSTEWKQRDLGRLATIYAPHRCVWFATGNNLDFGGDLARRVLPIRLESPLENPESRSDFKHPDLLAWTRTHRARLVSAALTVLRAHAIAGRPSCGCSPLGSYEAWSKIIPPALVWLGRPSPVEARVEIESLSDRTRLALVALLDGWAKLDPHGQGLTVAAVLRELYPVRAQGSPSEPDRPGYGELRETIETIVPPQGSKPPSAARLGNALRKFRRRVCGDRMFDCKPARAGVVAWTVVAALGGAGGPGGTVTTLRGELAGHFSSRDVERPTSASSPTIDQIEADERQAIQAIQAVAE